MNDANRRRDERFDLECVRVLVGSTKHAVINVSREGVLVAGEFLGIGEGEACTVTLQVKREDRWMPTPVEGTVVRVDDRGTAIHYREPERAWGNLLRRMAQAEGCLGATA